MKYLSTRNNNLKESFTNILFQGLSKDGGLYLPESWPLLDINTLRDKSYEEVALNIINPFVTNEVSEEDLYEIIISTYKNFSHSKIAPLYKIDNNKYILELFYGPTFAFKDYAMQFLGNLFSHCMQKKTNQLTILGATSGDTGSAAINAFKGKKNINVFILHPHNKVSEVQRKQMTTNLDENIFNVAIEGNFDDCQRIVKELFLDKDIQGKTSLTAINSINWARLMAQIIYYFWAYLQIEDKEVSFIVPSGNFGNVFSAHAAQNMGLPIRKLHIATNENDSLNQIIKYGLMRLKEVKQTYSPSMDIQISSNFERQIFESFGHDSEKVNQIMREYLIKGEYEFDKSIISNLQSIYESTAVSNINTIETISYYKKKYNYLSDPHTATGLSILKTVDPDHPYISLACAHPAKFNDAVEKATGSKSLAPKELENIFDKKEKMTILNNETETVKSLILKNL